AAGRSSKGGRSHPPRRPGVESRAGGAHEQGKAGTDTMTRIHRAALAALALVLAFVLIPGGPLHAAGEGRVIGTVADGQNKPIEGAKVLVTLPGTNYKQEKKTDKSGKFTLLILDATKEYRVRIEKDGFQPFEEALKPTLQETLRITYTLAEAAPKGPA